jgi:hypothetical protein
MGEVRCFCAGNGITTECTAVVPLACSRLTIIGMETSKPESSNRKA